MKVSKIHVRNFRSLADVDIPLREDMTLVIGRNNTGKTSLVHVMKKFLQPKQKFSLYDFGPESIEYMKTLLEKEDGDLTGQKISMDLTIEYGKDEDFGAAGILLMDLDQGIQEFVVRFTYALTVEGQRKLRKELDVAFSEVKSRNPLQKAHYYERCLRDALFLSSYGTRLVEAVNPMNSSDTRQLNSSVIKDVIALEIIEAKRESNNKEGRVSTLSTLAQRYRDQLQHLDAQLLEVDQAIDDANKALSNQYDSLFEEVIEDIRALSYNSGESRIHIESNHDSANMFRQSTKVTYGESDDLIRLPEDFNGLGYLNFFEIIFHIKIAIESLKQGNTTYSQDIDNQKTPALINLLFLEEPEAHTHPQMQYVFIQRIESIINQSVRPNAVRPFNLQTIITTHSPQIVSQANFNDINLMTRPILGEATNDNALAQASRFSKVDCKSLADMKWHMQSQTAEMDSLTKFTKKYISLNHSELFFAKKAVLIEGQTERILMPTFMQIIDTEQAGNDSWDSLLSQQICILEMGGAYAHKILPILATLNIRTLVITDMDPVVGATGRSVSFEKADRTSNATIKAIAKIEDILGIKEFVNHAYRIKESNQLLEYVKDDLAGQVYLCSQTSFGDCVNPSTSFEDAFLCENKFFFQENSFSAEYSNCMKFKKKMKRESNYYEIARQTGINKANFAIELMMAYFSGKQWNIPTYIRKGLLWLNGSPDERA